MSTKTADLCDEFDNELQVLEPIFSDFGGVLEFGGPVHTVKAFEDNTFVRAAVESPGNGRVLIVDGGGSLRCAMLGGNLAVLAEQNGWNGVIINGCVRDTAEIEDTAIGVKALATNPRRSLKKGVGETDVAVQFASATIKPDSFVYADEDGIVVSERKLD
ncbi:MAG: ribonuclease E activity regulator RraA [Pseudomonadota bacterium]